MFFNRVSSAASSATIKRPAKTAIFPAPKKGMVENDNIAVPDMEGAAVLENYYPTGDAIRLRKGTSLHATIDEDGTDEVRWLGTYEYGGASELYAANASSIFPVTSPGSATTEPTPVVTGLTNGNWVEDQYSTGGGHYLLMANGADNMLGYDGTYWVDITSAAVDVLTYDAETSPFTAGATLTGGTSGHTATIQRVVDNGTTGALLITGKTGVFQDNETITDDNGTPGSATADGTAVAVWSALSGVSTSAISHIWHHKSRLWMIEEGTMSAWYLGVDAIAGTATEFSVDGVFHHGGSLLFGATWSLDSGSGLDDVLLLVTTEGEVAVYQGTDPSSASTWSLVGVYQIGRPLHNRAWVHAGGDVLVVTDDGIVPISVAVKQDRASLGEVAATYPIEDTWRRYVKLWGESERAFEVVHWQKEAMFFVSMPQVSGVEDFAMVANSRTGAWSKFTAYDARCWATMGDRCFYGTSTGTVVECEVGGVDVGSAPYTGIWVPRFTSQNVPYEKSALHARVQAITNRDFVPVLSAQGNFTVDLPNAGSASVEESGDTWGTGVWGTSTYGTGSASFTALSQWQGVSGNGIYLVPALQVVSGSTGSHDIQIAAMWLQYEEANPF